MSNSVKIGSYIKTIFGISYKNTSTKFCREIFELLSESYEKIYPTLILDLVMTEFFCSGHKIFYSSHLKNIYVKIPPNLVVLDAQYFRHYLEEIRVTSLLLKPLERMVDLDRRISFITHRQTTHSTSIQKKSLLKRLIMRWSDILNITWRRRRLSAFLDKKSIFKNMELKSYAMSYPALGSTIH